MNTITSLGSRARRLRKAPAVGLLAASMALGTLALPTTAGATQMAPASATRTAACNRTAIEKAVPPSEYKIFLFGCSDAYAYALVRTVPHGGGIPVPETILMHSSKGRWRQVSRAAYCHLVPKAIRNQACLTN